MEKTTKITNIEVFIGVGLKPVRTPPTTKSISMKFRFSVRVNSSDDDVIFLP